MNSVGISMNDFNPEILYVLKCNNKDYIDTTYHCHDFIEFSYVVSGEVTYRIKDNFFKVKEKTLLAFNPGVYHKESLNKGESVTELHFGFKNIKIDGLSDNFIMNKNFAEPFEFKHFKEDFHKCCLEIIQEEKTCDVGSDLLLKSLVMKLISLFLKEVNYVENNNKNSLPNLPFCDKSNLVKIILDYFDSNYMHNISLDDISKNLYISSVYVSKVFKERTGESPINYLINLRLEKARKLLLESDLNVKEIAQLVGYKDAYYFSKLFKKYFGKAPTQFRMINDH